MSFIESGLAPYVPEGEYAGSLVPREDVPGADFREPKSLGYLDSTFNLYRQEGEDGAVRFVAFSDHPPINGDQLHDFLTVLAPVKSFADFKRGVIGDWNLVDRASTEKTSEDSQGWLNRLVSIHEHLGKAWDDFLVSRPAFLAAYTDTQVPYFGEDPSKWLAPSDKVRRSEHIINLARMASKNLSSIAELLVKSGLDEETAKGFAFDAVKREVNRNRSKSHPIERESKVLKRFNSWGEHRRVDFITKQLMKLDPTIQKEIIDLTRQYNYETIQLDDGTEISINTHGLRQSLTDAYAERKVVAWGRFRAETIVVKQATGNTKVVLPNSLQSLWPASVLSPVIAWERTRDGNRRFVLPHLVNEGNEQVPTHTLDGVLGLLAVAYASPQARADWPKQRGLPGSKAYQQMNIPQVPVLALMYRARLANAPFIRTAERIADEAVHALPV
jgi:hypothetical protein